MASRPKQHSTNPVAAALRALAVIAAVGFAGVLGAGCGDNCRALSEKICKCEPTEARQQACIRRIDTVENNTKVSNADETRCEQILDSGSCTCSRLADGDLVACGLSVE